jgi:ABC-type dipeptide/oligopeptide/nickel transport system permease component
VDTLRNDAPAMLGLVLLLALLVFTVMRLGPRFLVRRLASTAVVALGVSFITFTLVHLAPTNALYMQLGVHYTPQAYAELARFYGLDLPWWRQYLNYLGRLLHFDLGSSFIDRSLSVWDILRLYLPTSAQLGIAGIVWSVLLGIPTGLLAAVRAESRFAGAMQTLALVLYAVPIFVLIPFFQLLMLSLHGHGLPSLPISGWGTPDTEIAPIALFGTTSYAYILRLTRASMLEILQQEYVRTARAKGLRERVVVWRHAFRNAAIPLLSALGPALAGVVGGVFVVENLFNIPGIGQETIAAIQNLDFPVVEGTTILLALAVVVLNLATDVAYGFADPRIRTQ